MQLDRHLGNASAARWIGLAVAPIVCALTASSPTFAATRPPPVLTDYSILNRIIVNDVTAPAVNSPPVNGFVPQVVMGLTNQADPDPDDDLYAAQESTLTAGVTPTLGSASGGNPKRWLPSTAGVKYTVATFDTGSQSYIVGLNDVPTFGLSGNLLTDIQTEIAGASGTEFTDLTVPIGVYYAGLNQASNVGGAVVATGTMAGQYGAAILAASDPTSVLPNIVGAPIMAQYQVAISNSNPQTLTVGSTTYRSPNVTFTSLSSNPSLPSNFYRMTLDATSPSGPSPYASYLPDYGGIGFTQPVGVNLSLGLGPGTPTFWMSMFANVSGTHGTTAVSAQPFLFDTGSQVTVFSEDTAAEYGFFTGGPHQSTPDFTVEVAGVGGTTSEVPGFYVDQLKVLTNGGYVTWNHVPVLVIDLPDARDGVGYLPGVLGMNLFTDRDLVVNGGLTNPAVSFSERMQWYVNGPGLWSESAKWMLGTPNSINRPAQFLGQITSPQTITVDGNYTVGSLVFDNTNRYTLSGAGRITVQTTSDVGDGAISVFSGSHTINSPVTLANATTINVAQATSKLTITNDVTATGIPITKTGDGTVEMKNVRADSLALSAGTVSILLSGANASTSVLNNITAAGGNLDLQNNKLIVKGAASGGSASLSAIFALVASGRNNGAWNGPGIITSLAPSRNNLITLAIATADQLTRVGQSFGGQPLATGDVVVMYTYAGDANLSGNITGDDYFQIDQGFGSHGTLTGYFNGDFNYDGKINADDYFLIDRNYSAQTSTFSSDGALAGDSLAPVPEPASLALLALGAAMVLPRRRCQRSFTSPGTPGEAG